MNGWVTPELDEFTVDGYHGRSVLIMVLPEPLI